MPKKGLLERLKHDVLIGDGGFVIALEKRGYVKGGPWTPEAAAEHPEAVRQLHREFLRSGSDIMTTFTFYSADDKLNFSDNSVGKNFTCTEINDAACRLARDVADEGDALVGGSICQNPCYLSGKGKEYEQREVQKQIDAFKKGKVDFIIFEFFMHVEEIEWCIEQGLKSGLPVVANMCISHEGDRSGVSTGECAVRMAKAGAHVVGINCMFDPPTIIKSITAMKTALREAGLNTYLMTQPNGFFTTGMPKELGYFACPEYPFAMETRVISRFDAHKYAREAYNLGVNIIGGCCGFEAYHIRAIAEELHEERGKWPPASDKHEPWGNALRLSVIPELNSRVGREYWENLVPDSGRPVPSSFPTPHASK